MLSDAINGSRKPKAPAQSAGNACRAIHTSSLRLLVFRCFTLRYREAGVRYRRACQIFCVAGVMK